MQAIFGMIERNLLTRRLKPSTFVFRTQRTRSTGRVITALRCGSQDAVAQ